MMEISRLERPVAVPGSPDAAATVYVVDDDISVRESLEGLIRSEGWQPQIFASATEFLAEAPAPAANCAILDVSLPDLNGLDLQEKVAMARPDMPIIFITGHGDVPMTVRAMKAGAVEFLTKPFGDETLIEAIRGALKRSGEAREAAIEIRKLQARYELLSPREKQVMVLVVTGLMNKQVGAELGISEI